MIDSQQLADAYQQAAAALLQEQTPEGHWVGELANSALSTATAVQIHRGKSVGALLVPIVILGLVPHCACHAPINTIWHGVFGGVSPTCNMVPLDTVRRWVDTKRGPARNTSSINWALST